MRKREKNSFLFEINNFEKIFVFSSFFLFFINKQDPIINRVLSTSPKLLNLEKYVFLDVELYARELSI